MLDHFTADNKIILPLKRPGMVHEKRVVAFQRISFIAQKMRDDRSGPATEIQAFMPGRLKILFHLFHDGPDKLLVSRIMNIVLMKKIACLFILRR